MARYEAIYHALERMADPAIDRSLAAALPTAGDDANEIARLLIKRQDPDGLVQVFQHFDRLTPQLQHELVQAADQYRDVLLIAARAVRTNGPANVVRVVRQCQDPKLAYLLNPVLRSGGAKVRHDAAGCLLELAQSAVHGLNPPQVPSDRVSLPEALDYLQPAVADAVADFEYHHQLPAVLALLVMAPQWSVSSYENLRRRSELIDQGVGQLLREPNHASARKALIAFLATPSLVRATREGFRWVASFGGLSDVMRTAHLLGLPWNHRAVAELTDGHRLVPSVEELTHMRAIRTRMMPRWLSAVPMEEALRVEALGRLRSLPDPLTRLGALRKLIDLHTTAGKMSQASQVGKNASRAATKETALRAVYKFCDDDDETIARIALRHLIAVRWAALPQRLAELATSAHASVRELAGVAIGPFAFGRFWENWPKLPAGKQNAAGRALLKIAPTFHQLLRKKLMARDQATKSQAVDMILSLELGAHFEKPLIALLKHKDPTLVATAVSALASAESPADAESLDAGEVIDALQAMLNHPDSRVRANAVQSLERFKTISHFNKLLQMAQSEDNRPRANAIKALIDVRTEDAMQALRTMLADRRPMQRISALWLVQEMGLMDVVRTVAELSLADPIPQVKQRAGRAIHHLIQMAHKEQPDAIAGVPRALIAEAVADTDTKR